MAPRQDTNLAFAIPGEPPRLCQKHDQGKRGDVGDPAEIQHEVLARDVAGRGEAADETGDIRRAAPRGHLDDKAHAIRVAAAPRVSRIPI